MIYGYARVSTQQQELISQIEALKSAHCEIILQEKITGTKLERNEFNRLLSLLKPGDTIVVTKLDRFARSTRDALCVINQLFQNEIKIHVLNMGLIENTPTGRLIFTIFSAFAEFERDLIIERTQEGKRIAKTKNNFREGRPKKYTKIQLEHALSLLDNHSYKQVSEMTGISKSTLVRYMRSITNF
ncbi:recombinase family protein [Aerococcaceae bacterium NML190938]|nr:recombinase family protein [Aerococcaceae bacterium NML190938]